jgi:phosphotransferase system HPr (HPr) family protein
MIMPLQDQQASVEFDLLWYFEHCNLSLFTHTAKEFVSTISVSGGGEIADAKQWMELMMLPVRKGDHIKVSASGPDAYAAIEALRNVLSTEDEVIADNALQRTARGRWLPKP